MSGRTISIAVHPTNPNTAYVGTANGGLYRTTDGGTIWTALFDTAQSLAVGAVAIAPSDPVDTYAKEAVTRKLGSPVPTKTVVG